jgi:hypothetical protein
MSVARFLRLMAVASLIAGFPAVAFQIGSGVKLKPAFDLHETFTAVAEECVKAALPKMPENCVSRYSDALVRAARRQAVPANNDSYASRWPDDPFRLLDGKVLIKKRFGLAFENCPNEFARGRAIDDVGLLCSSHFGRLQFMHAQSRPEDHAEGTPANDRSPALTRQAILAWARFAYRAAIEPSFRSTNYCAAVDALNREEDRGLAAALAFSDRGLCSDRTEMVNGKSERYLAWQVGRLFGTRCFEREVSCWDHTDMFDDEMARFGARGAILHLIQDSFSQSHVARIPSGGSIATPKGPFNALVVCRSPSRYYDYSQQTKKSHGKADYPPELDPVCNNPKRPVDDIITASAMVLYYLNHPNPEAFGQYMATRVFPG